MAFFRRRTKPPKAGEDVSTAEWKRAAAAAGMSSLGTHQTTGGTYETYRGADVEKIKALLRQRRVDRKLYYVIAETPDGVWGVDIDGIFLEHLRSWQLDLGSAETTAQIVALPDSAASLAPAAAGHADNWIVEVECGACAGTWLDGVRYQNLTVVRCPHCGVANRIDSSAHVVRQYDI